MLLEDPVRVIPASRHFLESVLSLPRNYSRAPDTREKGGERKNVSNRSEFSSYSSIETKLTRVDRGYSGTNYLIIFTEASPFIPSNL